jgi:hypothetical protein
MYCVFKFSSFYLCRSLAFLTVYVERKIGHLPSRCYDIHDTDIYVLEEVHVNTWIIYHSRLI